MVYRTIQAIHPLINAMYPFWENVCHISANQNLLYHFMAILDIYMKSENFIQDDPKTQESIKQKQRP
jgi:hypothetical protein